MLNIGRKPWREKKTAVAATATQRGVFRREKREKGFLWGFEERELESGEEEARILSDNEER